MNKAAVLEYKRQGWEGKERYRKVESITKKGPDYLLVVRSWRKNMYEAEVKYRGFVVKNENMPTIKHAVKWATKELQLLRDLNAEML